LIKIYFRTLLPSHSSNQNNNDNQVASNQANPPAPTLLSFHHSHPNDRRHSRNMRQPSSLWRKTQDSFVRLDDGDEESVVGVGIAKTTDAQYIPASISQKQPVAHDLEISSEEKTSSSPIAYSASPQQTLKYQTTTTQSSSSPILPSALYWPTSRSWSEKIDGIGSIASDTELSDMVCSSPTLSTRSTAQLEKQADKV